MYKDYNRLLLSWRKDKVLPVTHKGIWIMEEVLFSKTFKANFRLSFYYYKCEFPWPLWKQMEARIQVGVFLWYLWRNCFLSFLRNKNKTNFWVCIALDITNKIIHYWKVLVNSKSLKTLHWVKCHLHRVANIMKPNAYLWGQKMVGDVPWLLHILIKERVLCIVPISFMIENMNFILTGWILLKKNFF